MGPDPPGWQSRRAAEAAFIGPGELGSAHLMTDPNNDEREQAPEDIPEEPGAEGGSQSPAADKLPGAPADDDSPVGDTDQHSKN